MSKSENHDPVIPAREHQAGEDDRETMKDEGFNKFIMPEVFMKSKYFKSNILTSFSKQQMFTI